MWSYTVMYRPGVPGFEQCIPHLTALVELKEQPLLLLFTDLPGTPAEPPRIGQRVRVTFEPLDESVVLPQFLSM
jgi:uncharacterized OB-fold protein